MLRPHTTVQGFEEIKHTQDGFEFWTARELMVVLGYQKWERFLDALSRAKKSCESSEKPIEEHFFPAPGKTSTEVGGRPREDYLLTRYA